MNVVKGMEGVLFQEFLRTIKLSFKGLKQDASSQKVWTNQLAYFKQVVRFYMLDLDIKEFKDLKLPSEKKSKVKQPKSRSQKQPIKPRFRTGGKQLQLFFTKTTKKAVLASVILIEKIVKGMEGVFFKDANEFDNRLRS